MSVFTNQPDAFSALHKHAAIGWDLDMTLVGHPASASLHAFIRATPHIRHVIVTFRSASARAKLRTDLAEFPLAPDIESFHAVEMIDDALAAGFARLHRNRAHGFFAGPTSAVETAYLSWKGRICAQWGATLLVDDMTEYVRLGCNAHGIQLLHPDIFSSPRLARASSTQGPNMIRIAVFLAALHGASALAASLPNVAPVLLRMTQVDADNKAIGQTQEAPCPVNGCQIASLLKVNNTKLSMTAVITFAGQGTYLALETAKFAPRIHHYGDTRAAPIFLPKPGGRTITRIVPLTVESQNTTGGTTLDAFLRVEIGAPSTTPQG